MVEPSGFMFLWFCSHDGLVVEEARSFCVHVCCLTLGEDELLRCLRFGDVMSQDVV